MDLAFLDPVTIANATIIASIFYAIHSSVRTRRKIERGRTNIGMALILIGLWTISMHYLANMITLHYLPHFMSVSDTWAIMRSLRLNGYWVITGSGLLCLMCGLHLVFRDLRTISLQVHQAKQDIEH
jgi:uncharacterized membrane protein HdeD (DUF308 family)